MRIIYNLWTSHLSNFGRFHPEQKNWCHVNTPSVQFLTPYFLNHTMSWLYSAIPEGIQCYTILQCSRMRSMQIVSTNSYFIGAPSIGVRFVRVNQCITNCTCESSPGVLHSSRPENVRFKCQERYQLLDMISKQMLKSCWDAG